MIPQDSVAISPLGDKQLFYAGGAEWQTWHKPLGKGMAYMLCVGGAGGGGVGGSAVLGGGGGGGSGAMARLLIPLWLLPDTLYVQVGLGGVSATGGSRSFISLQPNSTPANCYLASGTAAAGAGGTGTTSEGAGGTAESAATTGVCILSSNGIVSFIVGIGGALGNAGVTALANIPLTGGAGGGSDGGSNGGAITGAGLIPTIPGGLGSAITGGTHGNMGITFWGASGFMSCGGSGGGGSSASTGATGGNGGIGSGGGGGGGGLSTGGNGGAGGNGLVAIWCF